MLRSRVLPLAVALLVLLLGGVHEVRAQSTTSPSNTTPLTPLTSPNGVITLIPNSQGVDRLYDNDVPTRPWWISYDDCIRNDQFIFSLSATSSGDTLEVWAGTENCATNRSSSLDRGQCWMVGSAQLDDNTVTVTVPVRNVVARILSTVTVPSSLGTDVCDNSNDSNGEAISWYFMVVEGGQATEYFAWNGNPSGTGIDVVGPAPPRRISVGVGENQLSIGMDPDDIPKDTTRERYEAFCVPAGATANPVGGDAGPTVTGRDAGVTGGVASLLDGGTVFDAGVGTGTGEPDAGDEFAAPAACFTELLRAGERPPTDTEYSCGTTNAISGTLRTKGNLINGQSYAVAVSGQDELGNAGVISSIQCGTPMVLEDFYELYKSQDGPGGGGFCSFSPPSGTRSGAAAVLLVMTLVGLRRRGSRGRA